MINNTIKKQANKFFRRLTNLSRRGFFKIKDNFISSFSIIKSSPPEINRLIPDGIKFNFCAEYNSVINNYLNHNFNLLGSGWTHIDYDMQCKGFAQSKYSMRPFEKSCLTNCQISGLLNKPNRDISARIRRLISRDYVPIDWQIDFKSGFRWSEHVWYRDIQYEGLKGVDIKVPWELSRMQHLIDIAGLFSATKEPKLHKEFCNQVLDFIAANPPRFGVNWACTMDVGIRIANWLISYDIFCCAGVKFKADFKEVFIASVIDHANHIMMNLEWSEDRRSNHYLANIAGLLVAAIYLPGNRQTNAWLVFAIQELGVETERQFLKDGSHFESSTNYHRLCSEMIAVCAAFLETMPKSRISDLFNVKSTDIRFKPGLSNKSIMDLQLSYQESGRLLNDQFYNKLFLAGKFTYDLTKPDGTVPQIGDNDSGRFIRFADWVIQADYEQDHLNHYQLLDWVLAFFEVREILDEREYNKNSPSNSKILAASLVKRKVSVKVENSVLLRDRSDDWEIANQKISELNHNYTLTNNYKVNGDLYLNAKYLTYTNFGAYIIKTDSMYLLIRCGNAMNDGCGIHAHEDQLSFELMINEKSVTLDPGSYIYTSSKSDRNTYRSSLVHCAPSVLNLNYENRPIFSSPIIKKGECLYFGKKGFIGKIEIEGIGSIMRKFAFYYDSIEIFDYYSLRKPYQPASDDLFKPAQNVPFSLGYGIQKHE